VLGIDLGTTFTAAAIWRDGHAEVASLGSRAASVPSVVLLRDDETILTGEAASRRGLTEPQRVAREFKRRLGDTTPLLLGGTPYSAEQLMSRLLRWTVDEVATREGAPPARLCICHPANWGPYKRELLDQAVRLANIDAPVTFTTEPEAAAVFYAHQQRIEPGAVVAVYDLGGGTFDAAVLRKTDAGFEILGQPEGIERLGGIDFDAAVFDHVRQALDGKLDELDPDDPASMAAVARLREECVTAKEALSSDTDAAVPVLLPNLSTEVRITRAEFETMVRPALASSIEAMRRALRSAGITPEQLHSVLLVGGSSRMPLVSQLVGAELGRPVAVDAHPKHAIALGAAWLASGVQPSAAGVSATGAPAAGATAAEEPAVGTPAIAVPAAAPTRNVDSGPSDPWAAASPTAEIPAAERAGAAVPPPGPAAPAAGNRRRNLLIGAAALVAALAVGGAAVAFTGGDGDRPTDAAGDRSDTSGPGASPGPDATAGPDEGDNSGANGGGGPDDGGVDELPADERCTDEIMANERWVCLTSATFDGTQLVIEFEAEWAGGIPATNGGYHLHIYGGDGTTPADEIMGAHASNAGSWQVEDRTTPLTYPADHRLVANLIGAHPKVCARIADPAHALVPAQGGGFTTGNCVTIARS
jgi:molecular chaperone DnaK